MGLDWEQGSHGLSDFVLLVEYGVLAYQFYHGGFDLSSKLFVFDNNEGVAVYDR